MVFNSLAFLVFLPLFFLGYGLLRGAWRLGFTLAASYLFYGWWDWRFLSLIAVSTLIDYAVGARLHGEERPAMRRAWLVVSLCSNLGILGVFKYYDFFARSLNAAVSGSPGELLLPYLEVVLPVGISFYTFQTLSYTIDIFRRKLEPEPSLLRFATYVAFFPQLVAGPIVRANLLLPQMCVDHPIRWDRLRAGFNLVLWGYVLKVAVADSLAFVVDHRFAYPGNHDALSLAVGVVFYAFQIYGDFCGYSLIAIGIGRMLGFDFGVNFNRPYFAASFSEFWTRWHISLSSWLRDYLYIPLGGSRGSTWATFRNLLLTMFLGGLWHGANWTFVAWGLLHGFYLVLQRVAATPLEKLASGLRLPGLLQRWLAGLMVFALVCLAWIFFRAQSLGDALFIVQRILSLDGIDPGAIKHKFQVAQGVVLIGLVFAVEALSFHVDFKGLVERVPLLNVAYVAACAVLLAFFGTYDGNAFIYFQF